MARLSPSLLRLGATILSQKVIPAYCKFSPQIQRHHDSPHFTSTAFLNASIYPTICKIPVRTATIFTSLPGDVIWEGVTGPKGSTKKRARGKRRVTRPKIDLNRGQRLGGNREGYLWPGLNAPLFGESSLQKIQKVFLISLL